MGVGTGGVFRRRSAGASTMFTPVNLTTMGRLAKADHGTSIWIRWMVPLTTRRFFSKDREPGEFFSCDRLLLPQAAF